PVAAAPVGGLLLAHGAGVKMSASFGSPKSVIATIPSSATVSTATPKGSPRNHATTAGWPFASVATIRQSPGVPIDGAAKARQASRPAYEVGEPTGTMAASARSTSRNASASEASQAAMYPASSARARGEAASSTSSRAGAA